MKKESLEKVCDSVLQTIMDSDIDAVDKVELLINVKNFLDVNTYKRNIKLLTLHQGSKFDKPNKEEDK